MPVVGELPIARHSELAKPEPAVKLSAIKTQVRLLPVRLVGDTGSVVVERDAMAHRTSLFAPGVIDAVVYEVASVLSHALVSEFEAIVIYAPL